MQLLLPDIILFCEIDEVLMARDCPQLEAISNNKLVVIQSTEPKVSDLHDHCWISKNSIDCGIMGDIRACDPTDNGKLFILDVCGLLTQWDLDTLQYEKQYQLEWDRIWIAYELKKDLYVFNNSFTLLAVCLQALDHLFISVYLTENAMLLSQYKYEKHEILSHSEFISSDEGERLLLFFEDFTEIRDPYCLNHVKPVSNLCEEFSAELNGKFNAQKADLYMIKNERIYSVLEGCLLVQKFSKQQWIKFLRKKLGDYNEIGSLLSKSQIVKFLQAILDENINTEDDKFIIKKVEESYEGFLVKWKLEQNGRTLRAFIKLDSTTEEWNQVGEKREIQPEHLQKYRFVYRCELLDNEDLVMITVIGLLIWTVWPKKEIKLRYYKGFPFTSYYLNKKDFNNRYISGAYVNKESEYKKLEFFAKKPHIRKLFEEICDHRGNLLSPPDFDAIMPYYEELCMNKRYPFKELINDYIENKITLILYGQQLLRSFLNNKNYLMAEKLYRQCIKINLEDEKIDFLTNIKLLEIITFSFVELSQKFPDLLKEFLSHTSFIISSENKDLAIRNFSSTSHLQNHRKYPQPFNTSFINNLFNFWQDFQKIR
ncbi:21760_t:CDS:2 [Gigaspora margarita]|uniref:21760_t:CDS:1 n=1 Tax=Gigaspora margarita TaxID=4874 RepID=A0ABM8W1I7_GIGMA|nr:21760_t:CDS:2 [Gigaspora margarita]